MRRLMLLRHAKTETDAPSGRDQDRRLTERGRSDAAEIGSWLSRNAHVPDLVLVSPAVRTQQTWEIALAAMNDLRSSPRSETIPDLYGAEPIQLLQAIRMASVTDPKHLMVVGHNPGMHEIALALTGSGEEDARRALAQNMPTSGLAIFDFAIDDWNDVGFRGGHLKLFVSPKLLRQA